MVTTTADSGPGSLRDTLNAALPGTTITFTNGLSGQTILLTSGQLLVVKNFTIDASSLPAGIALNGNTNSRIFEFASYTTNTLIGLTLTNGRASGSGFPGNAGGAVLVKSNASLTIADSTLAGNSAEDGGGIYNSGTLTLDNSVVSDNSATIGGGIYHDLGFLWLTNSTLSGNSANDGGGVFNSRGTLMTANSTLHSNAAALGGGIYTSTSSGTTTISSSTLAGNAALWRGGGICNLGALTLMNSTLSDNSADEFGGGIYTKFGTVTLTNTIVAGNVAPTNMNIRGPFSGSHNLTNGTPLLAPLGNYGGPTQTMPPLPGSPAIDAGGPTTFATDQRGLARIVGSAADIGAVESGNPVPGFVPIVNTLLDVVDGSDNASTSLREALGFAANGSTITFDSALGTHPTILLTNGQFYVDRNLTIDASSLPAGIALNGNANSRIFEFASYTTNTLIGLTLTNAQASGSQYPDNAGGAVFVNSNASLTIADSTLAGNSANDGGGIYTTMGSGITTISSSTFAGNAALRWGGGIYSMGALTLMSSTLSGNSADDDGGGIFAKFGTLTLTNTIVAGNVAPATANIRGQFSGSHNLTNGIPFLAPLGDYGGPTQTMPPLPGSPAVDAGTNIVSLPATDQRGYPRVVNGTVDIGAVEFQSPVVLNTNDSGGGSLRRTIAGASPGAIITFTNTLSGQTILLTSSQLFVDRNLTIDASALANGITIDGNDSTRIFEFASGTTNTLTGLTLSHGLGLGDIPHGGAIYINSNAVLTVNDSSLIYNSTGFGRNNSGGGIYNNQGTLALNRSTLAHNLRTPYGSGIYNYNGTIKLNNSTVAFNYSDQMGGGIYNSGGILVLNNSTLLGNHTSLAGGGIYSSGTLILTNTVVAENSPNNITGSFTGSHNLVDVDPQFAPLGDYGGPTQTMPPLPGSPAIDAGLDTGSLPATDQRGYPRVVNDIVDIGAVEFQGASDATLAVSPTVLTPACIQGSNPPSNTFEVWNSGLAALGYTVSETNSWLSCTPTSGTSLGETNVITVNYSAAGLAPGTYNGTVTVTAEGAAGSPQEVAVMLSVTTSSFVVLNTNESGPGSLREAMTLTSPGGIITFTNTLSGQTILLTSGQILVDKSLSIDASSLPGGIRIDGNASSRIFEFASGTTNTLIGLTLTNGRASGSYFTNRIGGAILLNDGAGLTLVDCTASDNSAQSAGGGIFSSGMLTLNHTILRGNSSGGGGGIYTMRGTFGGTLTLTNSTVSYNSARWGGGIYNTNINLITISASTLSGNSATNSGGGIYNVLGTLALNNSTLFTNTTATSLGTENGGGIYTYMGPLAINNSTLFGNVAHIGAGIYSQDTFPTLTNTIVAWTDALGTHIDNIYGSFSGANNLIDVDPKLAPLGDYGGLTQTMPPLPGSPAIDPEGGDTTSVFPTDQRGYQRLVGSAVDIGAVEFQGASPEETLAWWRFEDGTDGADVVHADLVGVFSPDVPDSSSHGNPLSVWSTGGEAGYGYRSDVAAGQIPLTAAANNFSVQNTGGYPTMFTSSNAPIHTITPRAWTIEVAFRPENTASWRTLVGRDSRSTATIDTNLAALYLQIQPDDALAIKFCDVSGVWHQAISVAGLVQGFTYPYASTGQWQAAVATCDGNTLKLYYKNFEGGEGTFTLVAQTDLTASGSPDRRLTAGAGSGSDWTHGTWSVGRGLYAGGHTDRAWGFIDEVRISQGALTPDAFLFPPPTPVITLVHRFSFNGSPGSTVEPDLEGDANGTVLGTASYSGTGRLLLDGATGSYVDLPNGIISVLSNATFEAWVTHRSTRWWERIFDFGISLQGEDASGDGDGYLFLTPRSGDTSVSNAFRFAVRPANTSGESPILNGPGPLPLDEEVHLVVSYNETLGEARLYANGVLVTSGRVTIPLSTIDDRNNWLGRSQWNDPYFTGAFNEFRIYAGAMNDGQVAASYAAGPNAVIPACLTVLNTNDSGPGSLRQVIAQAHSGDTVGFTQSLAGQTIRLTSGQILVTNNLHIDATSLTNGIAIDGNASSRVFEFASDTTNTLIGLTLTNGRASGEWPDDSGGAVFINSNAVLTIADSTLSGNAATNGLFSFIWPDNSGGAVFVDSYAVLTITDSTLSGNSATNGGGIYTYSFGTLIVSNAILSGNSASAGGGVWMRGGTLTHCLITGNRAKSGGGAFCRGHSWVQKCTITANWAYGGEGYSDPFSGDHGGDGRGGGLYCLDNTTVEDCTITANGVYGGDGSADSEEHGGNGYGGGLYCGANSTVQNCFISANHATGGDGYAIDFGYGGDSAGGGLYCTDNSTVRGCRINANRANGGGGYGDVYAYGGDGLGGGLYCTAGSTVQNCTASGNQANGGVGLSIFQGYPGLGFGGGTYGDDGGALTNCIIWGNTADYYGDNWTAIGAAYAYCCTTPNPGGPGNITNAPLFVAADDYYLQASSPCIDAGINLPWMAGATDLEGTPRIVNGTVDIGAYEYDPQTVPILAVNPIVLTPECAQGTDASSETFAVWNSGGNTLSYTISTNVSWLSCSPTSGSSTGETNLITVNYTTASLLAGTYHGVITVTAPGASGSPQQVEVELQVNVAPPCIITQPTNVTVLEGQPATFTVTATGTEPLHYQWYFNGTFLPGATRTSVGTLSAQPDQAGAYTAVVTNVVGSVTSSVAYLYIRIPPHITQSPEGQTVAMGEDVWLSGGAYGTEPLGYRWTFNGTNIAGATSDRLFLTNVQLTDTGNYALVATNLYGSATSSPAVLTVSPTKAIIARWNFNSAEPDGDPTTGALEAYRGSGSATYVGGTAPAGTNTFFPGSNSDPAPSDNSSWVTSGYPLQGQGNKTAGVRFTTSTVGWKDIVVEWDQYVFPGASKYWRLQYTVDGSWYGDVPTTSAMNTEHTDEHKVFSIFGAFNNPNFGFQIVAEWESTALDSPNPTNNYYVSTWSPPPPFEPRDTYNPDHPCLFDMVTVYGEPISPPHIVTQPTSQTVLRGQDATFSVAVESPHAVNYRWCFNGTNLPGATTMEYTVANAQPPDEGDYTVVVTSIAGSVTSAVATLTVLKQIETAGDLLVYLDATALAEGPLAYLPNRGTMGGGFEARGGGTTVPWITPINGNGTPGIRFDGDDYLQHVNSQGGALLPADPGLVGADPTRSIEVWAFNPSIAVEETMVSIGKRGGPDGSNCSFNYGSHGVFGGVGMWGPPDIGWVDTGGAPTAGQWHHLVYTYDGTTTRLYVDGALVNSELLGAGVINTYAALPIQLGAQLDADGTTVTAELRGTLTLGRVRIHDGVLSDAQVLNNYNVEVSDFMGPSGVTLVGGPIHRYSFNNPATANATGATIVDSVGSADGMVINGSGTTTFTGSRLTLSGGDLNVAPYVDLPNGLLSAQSADNGGSGEITIEGWVRVTGSRGWSRIFDFGSTAGGELSGPGGTGAEGLDYLFLSAQIGNDVNARQVEVRNQDGATGGANTAGYGTFTFNTDLHFAVSWRETTGEIEVYENGLHVLTLITDERMSAINDINNWLGRSNWPDNNLEGEFDEFRIYDRVLVPAEALGNYEAGPDVVAVGDAVWLTIVNNGDGTVTLSWPIWASDYFVESTAVLGTGALWDLIFDIPVEDGAFYRLTLHANEAEGYFRLSK